MFLTVNRRSGVDVSDHLLSLNENRPLSPAEPYLWRTRCVFSFFYELLVFDSENNFYVLYNRCDLEIRGRVIFLDSIRAAHLCLSGNLTPRLSDCEFSLVQIFSCVFRKAISRKRIPHCWKCKASICGSLLCNVCALHRSFNYCLLPNEGKLGKRY